MKAMPREQVRQRVAAVVDDLMPRATVDEVVTAVVDRLLGDYVLLRPASYRRAQERQRLAESRAGWETQAAEHARHWAHDCLERERLMRDRTTYLYGLAARLGATQEQLRGPA